MIDRLSQHPAAQMLSQEFIVGGAIVSSAYLLGVWVRLISRAIVDTLSEWGPRPLLLGWLCRRELADELGPSGSLPANWRGKLDRLKQCALKRNNFYRESIKKGASLQSFQVEINKRRETGRLICSSLFPVCLVTWLMTETLPTQCMWASIGLAGFGVLLAYAYAEVYAFKECRLALGSE
jgi:hypothetical protein